MTSQQDIDAQREELRRHLNELEDRLNPSKVVARAKQRIRERVEQDPTPFIAAAAGAVVLVAGVVTLVVFSRRR